MKKNEADVLLEESRSILDELDGRIETLPESEEQRYLKHYRFMLKTNAKVLKTLATDMFKESDKTLNTRLVYAFSTACSQHREIIADLRSIIDLDSQAQTLIEKCLQPSYTVIAQTLSNLHYANLALIREFVDENRIAAASARSNEILTSVGKEIQRNYEDTSGKLRKVVCGEEVVKKKKKH